MIPTSLFGRTVTTVAGAFVLLLLVAVGAGLYYVVHPMAARSADDLAALMVLSAQTWVELPPETRPAFERELLHSHQLLVSPDPIDAEPLGTELAFPYLPLVASAIQERGPAGSRLKIDDQGEPLIWAEIPVGGHAMHIGFFRERLDLRIPTAALLTLLVGGLLALLTTALLVRRLTRPLARLAEATTVVGRGATPATLPESGADEVARLTRSFNRMAGQVHELLAGRTTLLSGISHDLRTPLARLRLALEMLPDSTPDHLRRRMAGDLDEMNRLIGLFLEVGRGVTGEPDAAVDLRALLEEIVAGIEPPIPLHGCQRTITAPPTALRRILTNLVDNAVRYGGEVEIHCSEATIEVRDRGPGIPPEQREAVFRPFHRLEGSRSTTTGGSGLGLAIVRQLAEANGWQVALLPHPGGGTIATLRLSN